MGSQEGMTPYILGIASEDFPLDPEIFVTGWMNARRGFGVKRENFGMTYELGRGIGWPLFFAHYSHSGFDQQQIMFNKRSYFEHFSEATEVHRHYALSRADEIKGYYKI